MTGTLHGKVHGRTIELDDDLGVADVFLDTVGLLAAWDIRDPWHAAADAA